MEGTRSAPAMPLLTNDSQMPNSWPGPASSSSNLNSRRLRRGASKVKGSRTVCFEGFGDETATTWTAPKRIDPTTRRRLHGGRSYDARTFTRKLSMEPTGSLPQGLSMKLDEFDRSPFLPRMRHGNSVLAGKWHKLESEVHDVHVCDGTGPLEAAWWYIVLAAGVFSMSMYGSFAQALQVNGALMGCWVATGLFLCFISSFLLTILYKPSQLKDLKKVFNLHACFDLAATGVASGVGSACMNMALHKTTQTDVYLFNSFPPTIIMLMRILRGLPVLHLELLGVGINLVGAYLNIKGEETGNTDITKTGSDTASIYDPGCPCPMTGAALGLGSSAATVLTMLTTKYYLNTMPTSFVLSWICLFSALSQFVFVLILPGSGTTITNLMDEQFGIFGWATAHWFVLWASAVAVIFFGQLFMMGSLQGLPALVVSMGQTVQPIVVTLISVSGLIGAAQPFPSLMSTSGILLIVFGCMLLAYASKDHQDRGEEVDENDDDE